MTCVLYLPHLSLTSRFGILESNLGLVISAGFQIPGNVEDEREALMIDVTKGSLMGRQSDLSWHFINPRSLIRRHCIYNVPDFFTFKRMKYKLLRCRKTSRSKDAVIQVEFVLFSQGFNFGIG